MIYLTNKELLIKEVSDAPDELVNEVLELIYKFRMVRLSDNETALLSEESLEDGWAGEEEDEAWKHL